MEDNSVEKLATQIQEECHRTVEYIIKNAKKANVQDATNVFIFLKLAELTFLLNSNKNDKQQSK